MSELTLDDFKRVVGSLPEWKPGTTSEWPAARWFVEAFVAENEARLARSLPVMPWNEFAARMLNDRASLIVGEDHFQRAFARLTAPPADPAPPSVR